ncbi:response regulator [Nodosilinea sp. PGN35]|uniref:ATP-binding response regulator n=1 Tax=Nodosilinea sp. PGN35 TaxID=3020489 RepID=UPI0023B24192|nr:response regulator [Nodosilinea sp. TSF1-S3]MDF0369735.1 response regulator [Nodosilinea sp. TSF1-S3]
MMQLPLILVVDDDPTNFEVIETFLEDQDYRLYYVNSGEAAIATLDHFEPDLILLDVMMPGLDGIEACRRIKAIPVGATIPVIMVTALSEKRDFARCFSAGANDFISKPINSIELLSRVRSMLLLREQYKQLQVFNSRLEATVQARTAQLQTLSVKLLEAQETERRFLAHELHDEIGQALTAIKISLRRLERWVTSPQASEPLEDCLTLVDGTLQQVRNISLDLRPSMLDDLGLVPTLRWYINRHAKRTGLHETLTCEALLQRLPTVTETACFRIVQEALTNIARHAQAQVVSVTLMQANHTLHLTIQDDGIGFDQNSLSRAQGTSLGILGMEERGMLIGGQLSIVSAPGQGTRIALQVPLAAPV